MPLYEFECQKCGEKEDHVVFDSDKDPITCKCGNVMAKGFPDGFRFKLLYDPKKDRCGWSNDGYAETQRYREYDKQAKHNIFVQPGVGKSDSTAT